MKNYQEREFSRASVRPTNRQESRFARISPGGCGIGICRMNGDVHDCMDAGDRAPKVGALGDAGSSCRGRYVMKNYQEREFSRTLVRRRVMYTTAWMQEVEQRREQLSREVRHE